MRYSRFIRLLHALVAIAISLQLGVSLLMDHPEQSRAMSADGARYFRWHEWEGLAIFALLAIGWLFRLWRWKREAQGRLFPWTNAAGRASLARELKDFARLRWRALPDDGALSGSIHGLGLVIASAMAVTGAVLYILLGPHDHVTATVDQLGDLHSALATLMWTYLGGHAFMALWHQWAGHGTLIRMFKL